MRRASFEELNCSVAQTLEVVGDWWSLLILRDIFFGVTRFDDIQRRLGVARNTLTDRLNWLYDHAVVTRVPYGDSGNRYEYRLTEKGCDLQSVLMAMVAWGEVALVCLYFFCVLAYLRPYKRAAKEMAKQVIDKVSK